MEVLVNGDQIQAALAKAEELRGAGTEARFAPEGTVSVRMHRRKKLTLVIDRRDLEPALVDELDTMRLTNQHLREKVQRLTAERKRLVDAMAAMLRWDSPAVPSEVYDHIRATLGVPEPDGRN